MRYVGVTISLLALAACGGAHGKLVGVSNDPHHAESLPRPKHPPPPLASHLVATVIEGTLGPFLARNPEGGSLAVYASRTTPTGRQIVTVPLDDHMVPRDKPRLAAVASGEVDGLVVRPVSGGYAVAWSVIGEHGGSALRLFEVDADGVPESEPFDLARSDKDIVWFEIVRTARGALCAWAEQTSKTDATILTLALDDKGHARGVPSQAVRGVVGWQALATPRGVSLATRDAAGTLMLQEIDADAQPLGAPTTIAKNVGADFDVVRADSASKKGAYVFAWTDKTELDPVVMSAWLDDGGQPKTPTRVSEAIGGGSFVAIANGGPNAFVAWEETGRRLTGGKRLHIASIDSSTVRASTAVDVFAASADLATDGTGVALLATTRTCPPSVNDEACLTSSPVPAIVRYDASLNPVSVAPVSVPEGETTALAWGIDCASKGCAALVASNESPTPVFAFDANEAKAGARLAKLAEPAPDAPRVESLATVASKEAISDFATAQTPSGTLLATMVMPADDPKAQPHAAGATIAVRSLDAAGAPSPATTLTTHAMDLGGVAAAAADSDAGGALVGWVAKDGGDPPVHVARVDAHAKKSKELLVTTEKGDAADVAIAWTPGAWLVAWVDWRDGNGEVYLARVALDGSRVLGTERITHAPGDASGVTILAPRDAADAWLAWADPRENPHEGFADIYVAKVHVKDGKKVGDDTRVLATAAHSRSPSLASYKDGVAIAWIEEAPLGEGGSDAHYGTTTASYGAMFARLDDKGHPEAEPVRTRGAGEGFPTSLALALDDGYLRAIAARAQQDAVVLDLYEWPGAGPVRAYPLAKLDGPPSMDVALALDHGVAFFDDELMSPQVDERRVRRLTFSAKK